jgi:dolichol-phosphate mannosyltransferase
MGAALAFCAYHPMYSPSEQKPKAKVFVVVPTFNESGNLPALAGELLALPVPELRLLIVDDASPDGTGRLADELAAASAGRMDVLHRSGPRGLGLAYVDGFCWALEHGADVVVQMDADFSHSPADVPRLVEKLDEFDVAVGSRYVTGGRVDDQWDFGRLASSRSANALTQTILALKTRDATSGFKAWRRSALEAVDLGCIRSKGYFFMEEMTFVSERLGLRICEVPIYFAARHAGRSKMSLRVKLEAALDLLRLWWWHKKIRQRL